jgi:NAD(P)-dependent dehydrogenase (short-subunit alcohol dehydrogenase family)
MSGLGLNGRTAFVTGAAGGIGRAVVAELAARGCAVALADVDLAGVHSVAAGLPGRLLPLHCDLAVPDSIAGALTAAEAALGPPTILVNAGAVLKRQALADITEADVAHMTAVNMTGALFLARAAAGAMKRAGGGRMVFFSSQGAFTGGYVGSTAYAMTKAGVVSMVKSLAREFAPDGITVNAIAPGGIDTRMLREGADPAALECFRAMIPMGRYGTPEEVARACVFLCSDWASYVTGHTLDVNGGQLMR